MKRMRQALLIFSVALFVFACKTGGEPRETAIGIPRMPSGTYTMVHNNIVRKYILHLPRGKEYQDNLALVLAFHGAPGTAKNLEENSLLSQKADAAGFIVAYPDGLSIGEPKFPEWNVWNCCTQPTDKGVQDVAYVRRLVERLVREYKVDRRKIYATGFSRGGMFSQLLACEASDLFTGIADVAGALNFDDCKPKRPVDVLMIHGRGDMNVRFGGAPPKKLLPLGPGEDRPVSYAMKVWQKNNHCRSGKTVRRGTIERTDYRCTQGALRLIALDNEAHSWPGSLPGMLGTAKPTQEISATDEMWTFWARAFKARSRRVAKP